MDLIDWDEGGFRAIERDFNELMAQLWLCPTAA